jgi:RecA-family ATPase
MEDWLPLGQCVGLYGIPGVRKSLWLLQALISGALGRHFCGLPVKAGPTFGLFCEDDEEEIARRAQPILDRYGRDFAELDNCHCTSLVGVGMTDFVRFTRSGRIDPTPVFRHWREQLLDLKPVLVTLDVVADFFGGNENDRGQVSAFLALLDGTLHEANCAGVYSAHPSRRGIAQGSLDSGSTGWEGKSRARLVLHDPAIETEDDEEESFTAKMLRVARNPSDERVLTRVQSNYALPGEQITLVLRNGVFVPKDIDQETAPMRGPMRSQACDAKFLELLDKVRATPGRYVNDNPSTPNLYAPTVFAQHEDHGNFTKRDFVKALGRLLGTRIEYSEERHGKNYHRTLAPK